VAPILQAGDDDAFHHSKGQSVLTPDEVASVISLATRTARRPQADVLATD
jgi:hypothetical protein